MSTQVRDKVSRNDAFISEQLRKAQQRIRLIDLATACGGWLAITLGYAVLLMLLDRALVLSAATRQTLFLVYAIASVVYFYYFIVRPLTWSVNPHFAARQLEHTLPGSRNHVINWIDLQGERVPGTIRSALGQRAAKDLSNTDVEEAISSRRAVAVGSVAGVLFGLLASLFIIFGPGPFRSLFGRAFVPFSSAAGIATRTQVAIIRPENGDAVVTIGSPITIVAEVTGRRPDAHDKDGPKLLYRHDENEPFRKRSLQQDHGDLWMTTISPIEVNNGFTYKVTAGDGETPEYRVTTRAAPLIADFLATFHYRPYVQRADQARTTRKLEDLRGTEVHLLARTNRQLKDGRLEFFHKDGQIQLIRPELLADDPKALRFNLTLDKPGKYRIRFTSVEGETYQDTVEDEVNPLPDNAPIVQLTQPAQDVEVPVNGHLELVGEATDDIGIAKVGLHVKPAGGPELQPRSYLADKLGKDEIGTPRKLEYRDVLSFGELKDAVGKPFDAKVGMQLEYWLQAADGCDYQEPNVGRSKVFKVTLTAAKNPEQQKKEQQQAQQKQQQQQQQQEQQLKNEKKERDDKRKQEEEQEKNDAQKREQEKQKGGQGNKEENKEPNKDDGKGGDPKQPQTDKGQGKEKDQKPEEKNPENKKEKENKQEAKDNDTRKQADDLQKAMEKRDKEQGKDQKEKGKDDKPADDKKDKGDKPGDDKKGEARGADEKKPGENKDSGDKPQENKPGETKGKGKDEPKPGENYKDGKSDKPDPKKGDKGDKGEAKDDSKADPTQGEKGKGKEPAKPEQAKPGEKKDGDKPMPGEAKLSGKPEEANKAGEKKADGDPKPGDMNKPGEAKDSVKASKPTGEERPAEKKEVAKKDGEKKGENKSGEKAEAKPMNPVNADNKPGKQKDAPADAKPGECKDCNGGTGGAKAGNSGGKPGQKKDSADGKADPKDATKGDVEAKAKEMQNAAGVNREQAKRDLQAMAEQAKDPAAKEAAKNALEDAKKAEQGGKPSQEGNKASDPKGEDGKGNKPAKTGESGKGEDDMGNKPGEGRTTARRAPGDPDTGGDEQPAKPEKAEKHRASTLQLDEFKKKVNADVLKDAKMSQKDFDKFLQDYADLAKRQQAVGEDHDIPPGPGRNGTLPTMASKPMKTTGKGSDDVRSEGRPKPPPEYRESHNQFLQRLGLPPK